MGKILLADFFKIHDLLQQDTRKRFLLFQGKRLRHQEAAQSSCTHVGAQTGRTTSVQTQQCRHESQQTLEGASRNRRTQGTRNHEGPQRMFGTISYPNKYWAHGGPGLGGPGLEGSGLEGSGLGGPGLTWQQTHSFLASTVWTLIVSFKVPSPSCCLLGL